MYKYDDLLYSFYLYAETIYCKRYRVSVAFINPNPNPTNPVFVRVQSDPNLVKPTEHSRPGPVLVPMDFFDSVTRNLT